MDTKIMFTVAEKTFDDYDEAMEYKKNLEESNADKQKMLDKIKETHTQLDNMLGEYGKKYKSIDDLNELAEIMGFGEYSEIMGKLDKELDKLLKLFR